MSDAGTEYCTLDALNRITAVSYPQGDMASYTCDASGNRLTKTTTQGGTTAYTYDDADELLLDGTNAYSYDQNGNLVGAGSSVFSWDHANRLVTAKVGSTTASYAYDGDGTRTSKTVSGTTTPYVWDREADLPLLASDGTNSYLSDTSGSLLGQLDSGNNATYYLGDALGSVRGTTQAAGTLAGSADYDVFGAPRNVSGSQGGVGYTGQQTDQETGFSYLRAREESLTLGRFLSADSLIPNGPGTQGYNPYAYVQNNPTTWVDPRGLSAFGTAFFIGTAITGACLLTPWCQESLADMYEMINDGLELAVTGAPIAAEVGAWMAVTGAIGMLFTLLACALDIEIAVLDGELIYGGCGGLALDLYYGLKNLASGNPFNQGPARNPNPPPPNPQPCPGWKPGPYVPPPGGKGRVPSTERGGYGFSTEQRDEVKAQNRTAWSDGQLHSDNNGSLLTPAPRKNNPQMAVVDHICPIALGGDNSYSNACLLSASENERKGTGGPYTCGRTRQP